eukprot:773020-Prorocentrum_minimum.AAC.1
MRQMLTDDVSGGCGALSLDNYVSNVTGLTTVGAGLNPDAMVKQTCPAVCCASPEECDQVEQQGTPRLRLAGGRVPWEGRIELRFDDEWRPVCATRASLETSMTVCRQLGYPGLLRTMYQADDPLYSQYWGSRFPVADPTSSADFAKLTCADMKANVMQCELVDLFDEDPGNADEACTETGYRLAS